MISTKKEVPNAVLVACVTDDYDLTSLEELHELAETMGVNVVGQITQNRSRVDIATCVGSGKVLEIKEYAQQNDVTLVIFDNLLSPSQLRNIEAELEIKTIDRQGVILDIFAMRANSAEGKVQVELAQLKYLMPRLRGEGVNLSRLAGGIGTRGPGESLLETNRRHISRRVELLKAELKSIQENRNVQRKKRSKNEIPLVAIAGYTNAGKSTLMNYLTDAGVLAENMLFATLDSTTRSLELPSGESVLISDTVGFIRNLPHELIYAFKSTLEEITYSDLVLLICDITNPHCLTQIKTAETILSDIGYKGNILKIYNKIDIANDIEVETYKGKDSVFVSATTGFGVKDMLLKIQNILNSTVECALTIPYSEISIYYSFKEKNKIISEEFMSDKIHFKANLNAVEREKNKDYII